MDTKKLERWAQQLLDTGKRNNLISFTDTKASTLEVLLPDAQTLYAHCGGTKKFEIFDPRIKDDENDEEAAGSADAEVSEDDQAQSRKLSKAEFLKTYSSKIKKSSQILCYSSGSNPINAAKNIYRKARTFLEETGVNVAYIAFGFVHWKENYESTIVNRAPLLLVPVTFINDSSVDPFYVQPTGDDIIVNPTFDYLLQAQYGISLPELDNEAEEDHSLRFYLNLVEARVKRLGWTVTDECKIGIFSFQKINMYYDLMNHQEQILANENVRVLLGEADIHDGTGIPLEEEVSQEEALITLHTVVDADSSQIEAIEMAKSGKSFVLQGPPGTGKSQTITNIIAECLYDGKKVLFVSEKMAALNVVYDKLKKAGLEEFCLELHSYKANKKTVIDELYRTLELAKTSVRSGAEEAVQRKARFQKILDNYAESLHKKVPIIGRSLFELFEKYSSKRNAPDVDFAVERLEYMNEAAKTDAVNLLRSYADYVPSVGSDYRQNLWYGYIGPRHLDDMPQYRASLGDIYTCIGEADKASEQCEASLGIKIGSLHEANQYLRLFALLSSTDVITPDLMNADAAKYVLSLIPELKVDSEKILPLRSSLQDQFDAGIFRINGSETHEKLVKLYSGTFSRLFNSEYKQIITELRMASKNGIKYSYEEAVAITQKLAQYQSLNDAFEKRISPLTGCGGEAFCGVDTDWIHVFSELQQLDELSSKGLQTEQIAAVWRKDPAKARDTFVFYAKNLAEKMAAADQAALNLQKDFDEAVFDVQAFSRCELQDKIEQYLNGTDSLENWVSFRNLLEQLEEHHVLSFLNQSIEAELDPQDIANAYEKAFYKQWIYRVIKGDNVLANFNRVSQDQAVEIFSRTDRDQFQVSKAQIKAKVSQTRPNLRGFIAGGSPIQVLQREAQKKRKIKSIRKLMEEIGDLIQILKPCFLMSPLSVSTFLEAGNIHFDTIVFDEASQIFPQDAIGAIYRGEQVIVVGDTRQMPPSNFFNSTVEIDDDDEDVGDVTDFESILDLCSTSMPTLRLAWHYRSRFEQLIAFSNKNFYRNSLITFPSPVLDREGCGIDYYHVDGVFDRKHHTNMKEAEYVVDMIYRHIDTYPGRSLGVVAFSVAQQNLIDRLLSRKRAEKPENEWFFSMERQEPFFIKNLETVQGDERDTIIFSVAYGPDSTGRLLMNFGPLNRLGGERRLNVAVTRAKDNVQIVSAMHSYDVDLSRTGSEGARLLHDYLDFAENGQIALEREIDVNEFDEFDSDFEMEVCEFLREHGYEVDTQIGCSGFRIDLGLKMPNSSNYVLAIECDGATYHNSKNARDRDRLRQEILEGMGWHFYRIWSTDWFRNQSVEKERLLDAAEKAVNLGPREVRETNTDMSSDAGASGDTVEKNAGTTERESSQQFEEKQQNLKLRFPYYQFAQIQKSPHAYFLQDLVKEVLMTEAPLSEEFFLKRYCYVFGRQKVTSVVRAEFERRMRGCEAKGIIRRYGFLYLNGVNTFSMRIPAPGAAEVREIKFIAPEELAAGITVMVRDSITAEKDDVFRALNKQLGFSRMGADITRKFEEALVYAKHLFNVQVDGTTLSLKQE